MTEVSVIVCAYNTAAYVGKSLESAFGQTLSPELYEVVFIDDGSTDGTEQAIAPYRRRANFRYIKHPMNQGVVRACNRGLEEARGAYVMRLDSDDTVAPSILEAMHRPLREGVTDFVYSDRIELQEAPGEPRQVSLAQFNLFDLPAAGVMFRRDLALEVGGYRNFFWEEFDLYLRYLPKTQKPLHHIPEALMTYVIRQGSRTSYREIVRRGWEELAGAWPAEAIERFGRLPEAALQGNG